MEHVIDQQSGGYHINRQIGDYVVYSKEANVAPFYVRMAGEDNEAWLSSHRDVTSAVEKIKLFQAADKRRSRQ